MSALSVLEQPTILPLQGCIVVLLCKQIRRHEIEPETMLNKLIREGIPKVMPTPRRQTGWTSISPVCPIPYNVAI